MQPVAGVYGPRRVNGSAQLRPWLALVIAGLMLVAACASQRPARSTPQLSPLAYHSYAEGGVLYTPSSLLAAPPRSTHNLSLNAYMIVDCMRGGMQLRTWEGPARWNGPLPAYFEGTRLTSSISWRVGNLDERSVLVNIAPDGSGGERLLTWCDAAADTIKIDVYRLDAVGSRGAGSHGGQGGQRTGSQHTGSPGGQGGRPGGSPRGKKGGVSAQQGGVDGADSRQFGEKFGAAQGARGGTGQRDDHGIRGASGLIGIINVPAKLRPLAEVLLIATEASPGQLARQWVKSRAASKPVDKLREALRREATANARARIRSAAKKISADKAFRKLSPVEQDRFLNCMRWDLERAYFQAVEESAWVHVQKLQGQLQRLRRSKGKGKLAEKEIAAELARTDTLIKAARVKPVAGKLPRNHRFAGADVPREKMPRKYKSRKLRFTDDGYPDFTPYARQLPNGQTSVQIKMTGSKYRDDIAANKAAGFHPARTPKNYTWHHHQDGTTMQLVPQDLHAKIGHTGGVAHFRHAMGDLKFYPSIPH